MHPLTLHNKRLKAQTGWELTMLFFTVAMELPWRKARAQSDASNDQGIRL